MHCQCGDGDFSPEVAPDMVDRDAKVAGYVGVGDVVLVLLVANLYNELVLSASSRQCGFI